MRKKVLTAALLVLALTFCVMPARSVEEPRFTLELLLYDAESLPSDGTALPGDAQPLDPMSLKVGQKVVAAVRYQGLTAMESSGIQCLAVSFTYDFACFAPGSFSVTAADGDAKEWSADGRTGAEAWMTTALKQGYTASASDRSAGTEGRRMVYLQFIGGKERTADTVQSADTGYLGAFPFTVKKAFSADEGVRFSWSAVQVGLYGDDAYTDAKVTNYSDSALKADARYQAPADVPVAASEVTGVTVSGQVRSYNPRNPVELALYRWDEAAGAYETESAYETTIAAQETGSGQVTQDFAFEGVEPGRYQLVVRKVTNLTFSKRNVIVNEKDIDWKADSSEQVMSPIILIVGDINEDRYINGMDLTVLLDPQNFLQGDPVDATADINGDGYINGNDLSLILDPESFLQSEDRQTFE